MTNTIAPTIDLNAAMRWQRMPVHDSPWLHEEVARRMQERLDVINHVPDSWLHWQPLLGGMQTHALLAKRYPQASCTVFESTLPRANQARQALRAPWWQFRRRVQVRSGADVLGAQPVQMLWSNMSLHMAAQPQAMIAQWHQALQTDGFLMFSCLGPDTLKELHGLYKTLGWPTPGHTFVDMHDWGDMLVEAGFAEPVMDMERVTLTFETPQRLLQELRGLGRNLHTGRFPGLRGRRWHGQLMEALNNLPLALTFEVIYGHAFKPAPRFQMGAQAEISLTDLRAALRHGKPAIDAKLAKDVT